MIVLTSVYYTQCSVHKLDRNIGHQKDCYEKIFLWILKNS